MFNASLGLLALEVGKTGFSYTFPRIVGVGLSSTGALRAVLALEVATFTVGIPIIAHVYGLFINPLFGDYLSSILSAFPL